MAPRYETQLWETVMDLVLWEHGRESRVLCEHIFKVFWKGMVIYVLSCDIWFLHVLFQWQNIDIAAICLRCYKQQYKYLTVDDVTNVGHIVLVFHICRMLEHMVFSI